MDQFLLARSCFDLCGVLLDLMVFQSVAEGDDYERQDNEELDSFYRYLLIKCQVADLCLPFALWGAAFGFSAIPKTLCDSMSKATEDTARELFGTVLASIEK